MSYLILFHYFVHPPGVASTAKCSVLIDKVCTCTWKHFFFPLIDRLVYKETNPQPPYYESDVQPTAPRRPLCLRSHCIFQAGALVHIYVDGSVLLTHGGVEMGQGLHTKMIQVSYVLNFDPYL